MAAPTIEVEPIATIGGVQTPIGTLRGVTKAVASQRRK